MKNSEKLATGYYIVLFITLFISFFYGFSSYAILNINEGLYAEIPREMMLTGNYLIPHLNFVPYIEKPPMLYWLISLSYHLFGIGAFAARLVPVSAGAITCLLLLWFGQKIKRPLAGWIAAMLLSTSIGFILISRVILFDMVLTAFMTAALMHCYLWYKSQKLAHLRIAYLLLGFAFMTKGILPLGLVGVIAFFFLLSQKAAKSVWLALFDWKALLLFLGVTVPWHVAAMIHQPGFFYDFFINEQILRFFHKRIPYDYHTGPFYYYIVRLAITFMPWTLLFPLLIIRLKSLVRQDRVLSYFLLLWFLVPFIIFSASLAKSDYYMVVAMPAVALLMGLCLEKTLAQASSRWLWGSFISVSVLLTTGLSIIYYQHLLPQILQPLVVQCIKFFMVYLLIGCGLYWWFRRHRQTIAFVLLAGLVIPQVGFYVKSRQLQEIDLAENAMGNYIVQKGEKRPLFLFRDFENASSLLFYSRQRIGIIDTQSADLYYGSYSPQAKNWFVSVNDFFNSLSDKLVYVAVRKVVLDDFKKIAEFNKFCPVFEDGGLLLMSNDHRDCLKPTFASSHDEHRNE